MIRTTASINGLIIEIEKKETILNAAKRLNINIPTLCYSDKINPEGGCRMCLVACEGSPRPVAACHTFIAAGMTINTHTTELEYLRREILKLYMSEDEHSSLLGDDSSTKFGLLLSSYGITRAWPGKQAETVDASNPYLRFNVNNCITCRLCLNTCEQIQGQFVYGIAGRGSATRLLLGMTNQFADSPCVACGVCVDVCPTGAITDCDRQDQRKADKKTQTVCGYCGVGCRLEVEASADIVLRINPVKDSVVNQGHLCLKGRYAHVYHHSNERLTQPLKKVDNKFVEITWNEALDLAAQKLVEIVNIHGSSGLGALSSSRSTNEAAYLLQRLFRSLVHTNNIDCCARVCHSSTALGLQLMTGAGAASASFVDIEKANCIVLAGANPTAGHPVLGARIKQAVLRGARLVVIDPRSIELADYADLHCQLLPGTNVALFNGITKILIEEDMIDISYLENRVEGLDELRSFVNQVRLGDVSAITSVSQDQIVATARLIGKSGPILFIHGLGLSELTQGTGSVMAFCNLGLLTGSIGLPGAGMLPLRGQNNVQGNADMGGMPNLVTGYQSLTEPKTRLRLENIWGCAPPLNPGLTIPEMLDAAVTGNLHMLWIQGEDIVQSEPNETHVREALANLDFLIVQELFFSETCQYADLIFPACAALEQEGTFTNGERRIQHVHPAVPAPGEARPDWLVIRDVALRMGANWKHNSPADIMDEIAQVAPDYFGGISYSRLHSDGLQWPCPTPDHPGTGTLHESLFMCGKGKLACIDYSQSPENGIAGYPFLLVTGRLLEHYNVGTMTRRTPNQLMVYEDVLSIHPEDAVSCNIIDGQRVKLISRWGSTIVTACSSRRMAPGTLFLSFHFPETHANRITGPHHDPQSKCPQYKAIAVRVEALN
jgi:formate dehydrogenase alpha subunit